MTTPLVTVGIPARNGGVILARAIEAVLSQEVDFPWELIAFDSGSTDGTLEMLARHGVRVVHIPQETFDWGSLREQLFTEAQGAIVVNLSQDAVPARPDWLRELVAPLNDPDIAVVCGNSIPDEARHFRQFQWEKNGYYYFTREIAKFTGRYGKGLSFANTAVRRSVWEELRIAPQATGEDFQFQQRLHASGHKIVFTDKAPVLHHHNYTLKGVYRRCRNEGLALRDMGCPYYPTDLVLDLLSPAKYLQWLREVRRGSLQSTAEWLYPVLRPVAVFHGSQFAKKMVWY